MPPAPVAAFTFAPPVAGAAPAPPADGPAGPRATAPSRRRPQGSPRLPPRPATLKAALGAAIVQTVVFAVAGTLLLFVANGPADSLQRRLDEFNSGRSGLSLDAFQHALDIVGAGSLALGVVVLLLASSAAFYGALSRSLLAGVEVVIAVAGLVGLTAHIAALIYVVLPLAVFALIVAPPTHRAFEDAAEAVEEWRSS